MKGTCIISLKAPPSDRIWFSFKDMPDIDMVPEPCIGDHLISNDFLGNFITNQIKVSLEPFCIFTPALKSTVSSSYLFKPL